MKLNSKLNKDIILYTCEGQLCEDKDKLTTNVQLSAFYAGKHTNAKPTPLLMNPKAIIDSLNDKLTDIEKYALKYYLRKN